MAEAHDDLQRLQARVWAPAAETLLDRTGVSSGWRCADLGCGSVGILPELSRRVGPVGHVIGLERDPQAAQAAREMVAREGLENVEIVEADLNARPLSHEAFDLVHLRFALHLNNPEEAIAEMAALARPGGWVMVEEPDLATWRCIPDCPGWRRLLGVVASAIGHRCEPSVGSRVPALMERVGLRDVQSRAVVLVLRDCHPYMRLPLCWAETQREEILSTGLATKDELETLVEEVGRHVERPEVLMLTFTTIQAWGRT